MTCIWINGTSEELGHYNGVYIVSSRSVGIDRQVQRLHREVMLLLSSCLLLYSIGPRHFV